MSTSDLKQYQIDTIQAVYKMRINTLEVEMRTLIAACKELRAQFTVESCTNEIDASILEGIDATINRAEKLVYQSTYAKVE